jgi:hypothetical protein
MLGGIESANNLIAQLGIGSNGLGTHFEHRETPRTRSTSQRKLNVYAAFVMNVPRSTTHRSEQKSNTNRHQYRHQSGYRSAIDSVKTSFRRRIWVSGSR